ncbi:NAD(P)-dependent oxidoreductase [Hydrogenothermus marinus]|uniref:3-hydroxyisobutyrate dehydrogenase n=1 Tax=Hydrogenothermus marinus TaxID=133270 RepID=A0A3M0BQQ8_9AQUI|nr:NAD(P)-dependent oxidoreductase [Hydrogenothermus marinus]RMA97168.1 3-hydroxyisobutyrate dehydrogenase [Hydrogenothermus marinus]
MKRVGWIGLGHIGLPLVKNLINAGLDVKVWNRTLDKAKKNNLPYTETLEELVNDRDIIITMLYDSDSVLEVYSKITKLDIFNKTFIDMTTIKPETVKKIAEMLIQKKANFLEAPVIGSVPLAEKGTLTILVSGDENIYKDLTGIFSVLGKEIIYVGDYTIATSLKLINNMVLASFLTTLTEAFVSAKKLGIDPKLTMKVLENGAGKSAVLEAKKEKLLNEDYSTHFSANLMLKDLNYAIELTNKINTPAVLTSISKELYKAAKAKGLGDSDFSSVLEVFKSLANLEN